jgi:hypothetical protein
MDIVELPITRGNAREAEPLLLWSTTVTFTVLELVDWQVPEIVPLELIARHDGKPVALHE